MSTDDDDTTIDRRTFLEGTGLAGLFGLGGVLGEDGLGMRSLEVVEDPIGNYPYREWEDLYRDQWDWDEIARATHGVNCTGGCSWNVYVKNGQVWREEQAGDYPRINDDLPDPNPRGCQKGACYKDYVNADQRITHPLRRTGERGEGQWERISWEEALTEIADHVLDELEAERYDAISGFTPIPAMSPVSFAGGTRLINLLGGVSHTFYDWYSDLPPGEPLTWGHQTDNAESADWYNADYIVAWGSNVNMTRIPDTKYFSEARYTGTKLVGVFPDYSQTAIHTDEWLAPDPGTDAVLALGMARTIVEEGLYDREHLLEQTDMPLLVREDTGKFLRASEVGLGDEHTMVMLDAGGDPRLAPGSLGDRDGKFDPGASIELDFEPQLSVDTDVSGIAVRSVWELLGEELAEYDPEHVHEESGVGRETHQRIAREFADVDAAKIIHGKGVNGWYHNDLGNRALQLLVTLTGNLGRSGTGFDHYVGQEKMWPSEGFSELAYPVDSRGVPTTLWTYYHAGIEDVADDELLDRIEESVQRGWMPLYPEEREDGSRPDPTTMFVWRGNYFNQAKGGSFVEETLWPKLDLVVDVNFRMDTTALYSDIVLPAASHYEKYDLNVTDLHSYVHPFTPAVEPLGESRTDWEVFRALAETIQKRARERGIGPIEDRRFDREIDPQNVHDDFVRDWTSDEEGALAEDRAAVEFVLEHSEETNPEDSDERITFDDTVEQPRRFLTVGDHWTSTGPMDEDSPYVPWQDHVQDRVPWRTYTGRQQYYIDHDWFLELDEQLPTHKPPIDDQDEEYDLEFITPHDRWSIHSTWRDDEKMLRLQRGGPAIYLHPDDAEERGIEDGDRVRVRNEYGEVEANAKIYHGAEPGATWMYFAWERLQFEDRGNFNTLTPMRMKPTQLVQYPEETGEHLRFAPNYWGPTGVNNDISVAVEPVDGGGQGGEESGTDSESRRTPADGGGDDE